VEAYMKIKYLFITVFVALIFFIFGFKIGEIRQYKNVTKIINDGNKIVIDYCNKYSYEKRFGILHLRKWNRFLELKYLVYDDEIHEVNVSFNANFGYFEGYDQFNINKMTKSYIEKYYPFLE
jgi:hypothetical protein